MSFNKFYFLHIPKTGGHYFRRNITPKVYPIIESNGIEIIHINHGCWTDRIDDRTYIMSAMRNPVKRTVSHFAWLNNEFNTDIENVVDINKENFFDWIEKYYLGVQNFQSKNIIFTKAENDAEFYKMKEYQNLDVTKEKVLEKINRINLMFKVETLNKDTVVNVRNKILKDLNIEHQFTSYIYNPNNNITWQSKVLYDSLTDFEIKKIEEMNYLDMEIYNTENIFWKNE